ncbi:MAG: drug/metabolite transporter (DMT)-like permease [Motiliproteus sp.]|jgi:drug/metabolite transporter (DMT)-like permease
MSITSARIAWMLLLLVCFIWGFEYVLIDQAIELLPTHTFNTIRFAVAALSLLPLLHFSKEPVATGRRQALFGAGLLLGFLLFIGFYTQTEGLLFTSVANAGFITGLIVPLVPLLGWVLFGKRRAPSVWFGVICASAGLYFLTIGDKLEFNKGDFLVLICAFAFALHIIVTGRVIGNLPVIQLSIIQLSAVSLYSAVAALLSPVAPFNSQDVVQLDWYQLLVNPLIISAILLAGILGSGFATWAQASSQRLLEPHKVALIFASEPVFAYLCAWFFLDEVLGSQGIIGGCLIIAGMLISELGDNNAKPEVKPLDHTAAAD